MAEIVVPDVPEDDDADVAGPFTRGPNPNTWMRLAERRLALDDAGPTIAFDVEAYDYDRSADGDDSWCEDDGHGYEDDGFQPCEWAPAPCPSDPSVEHCDHCGETSPLGRWMTASLGLACDLDCFDLMSNEHGAHARRYH
ncbi:hypothetical protein AB0C52_24100 [Streptomyces sp. NPDC048717]|uniref:hypothetical protein n=1 Tax=Streptomyces sp. NPDC048717 TaxID=3154928 RepID=UPI0034132F28